LICFIIILGISDPQSILCHERAKTQNPHKETSALVKFRGSFRSFIWCGTDHSALMFLMCPKCRSQPLLIRNASGIERLLIFLTKKRKYLCRYCGYSFRAADRRRTARDPKSDEEHRNARSANLLR
jgi:hypothetical protein